MMSSLITIITGRGGVGGRGVLDTGVGGRGNPLALLRDPNPLPHLPRGLVEPSNNRAAILENLNNNGVVNCRRILLLLQ